MAHALYVGDEEGGSRHYCRAKSDAQWHRPKIERSAEAPRSLPPALPFLLQTSGQMAKNQRYQQHVASSPASKQTHKTRRATGGTMAFRSGNASQSQCKVVTEYAYTLSRPVWRFCHPPCPRQAVSTHFMPPNKTRDCLRYTKENDHVRNCWIYRPAPGPTDRDGRAASIGISRL